MRHQYMFVVEYLTINIYVNEWLHDQSIRYSKQSYVNMKKGPSIYFIEICVGLVKIDRDR